MLSELTSVVFAVFVALWLPPEREVATTRYLIVVQGARRMSSWSWPIMFAPFLPQDADHLEGYVPDADLLADGRLSGEKLPHDRAAHDADLARVADVVLGESLALVHVGPIAHLEEGRGRAVDVRGHPVSVAVDDLRAGAHDGGHIGDGGTLLGDGIRILRGQGRHAPHAVVDAAHILGARYDHEGIGPYAREGALDGEGRPVADFHHGDDRRRRR